MTRSPHRRYVLAGIAAILPLIAGCGLGSSSRSPVKGSVSYDGQPIDDGGGIAFIPEGEVENDQRVRATGEIRDGKYDLDAHKGPFPGKYRVQIYWRKKTGNKIPDEGDRLKDEREQVIPAKYNMETELIREVQSGRNTIDFDLEK